MERSLFLLRHFILQFTHDHSLRHLN